MIPNLAKLSKSTDGAPWGAEQDPNSDKSVSDKQWFPGATSWESRKRFTINLRFGTYGELTLRDGTIATLRNSRNPPGPEDYVLIMETGLISNSGARIELSSVMGGLIQRELDRLFGNQAADVFEPFSDSDFAHTCRPPLSKHVFRWHTSNRQQRENVKNLPDLHTLFEGAINRNRDAKDPRLVVIDTSTGRDWYIQDERHAALQGPGRYKFMRLNQKPNERPDMSRYKN